MTKVKGILQKSSRIVGIICFPLAILCGVLMYLKVQEVGMQHPVSTSYMAAAFFFVCIGVVFTIMGTADIPSFDLNKTPSKDKDSTTST